MQKQQQHVQAAAHAAVIAHAKVLVCKGSSVTQRQRQQHAKAVVHAMATAHAKAEVTQCTVGVQCTKVGLPLV